MSIDGFRRDRYDITRAPVYLVGVATFMNAPRSGF